MQVFGVKNNFYLFISNNFCTFAADFTNLTYEKTFINACSDHMYDNSLHN